MPANFSGFFFLPAIIFVLFLTNKMDLIFIYIYIFFFLQQNKNKREGVLLQNMDRDFFFALAVYCVC